MKRQKHILFIALIALVICGCAKTPETNQNSAGSAGKSTNSNANPTSQSGIGANQNSTPQNGNDAAQLQTTNPTVPQAVLQGTYAISEVQHDGIVEIIGNDNTTEITFKPPASFSRLSKKNGNIDHTDSGQYKIIGDNQITLKIVMSKEKIQLQPVEKIFGFWVSSSGDEMKMITVKDKKARTAVFRRIRKLTN
jgi:hypothetical protein